MKTKAERNALSRARRAAWTPEERAAANAKARGYAARYREQTNTHSRAVWPEQRAKHQLRKRERREADPVAWRRFHRKYRYGLTPAAFDALLASQGGHCALCAKTQVVVDHDHKTNRVRGLLCYGHNTALGQFGDAPDELAAALDYLRGGKFRHPAKLAAA